MLELVNETGAGAVVVPGWDLAGNYRAVLVARLTLDFDLQGNIAVAEEQPSPLLADSHYGKPMETSLKDANEIGAFKQGAEYYLHGKAYTRTGAENRAHVSVEIRQRDISRRKQLVVLGEHGWEKGLIGARRGEPTPFAALPLRYENAYGGSHDKSGQREKHNPVGRGFNPSGWKIVDPRAPQIEYVGQSALSPSRPCPVAGFGPLPVFWAPRQARFGTPSEMPLDGQGCAWGSDAQPSLHHCAPQDQWLAHAFTGGETLTLLGFFADHPEPVTLTLPSWQTAALLIRRGHSPQRLHTECDTLVIDTEQRTLTLIARTRIDPATLDGQPAWLRLLAASYLESGVVA